MTTATTVIAISVFVNQCANLIVSQLFTRPRARQFERNTEERLANLEAENEWPPGIRRVVDLRRNAQGYVLHVEYECSGEEIQQVMTVNGKSARFQCAKAEIVPTPRRSSRLRQ